jgi:hypothetical protein
MGEKSEWVSLERLLDDYSISILAEAIDKFGLQTIDNWGKRVLANDGEASDTHSKAFAKAHLAQRRAFEFDPLTEDEQYWFDERIQTHGSALDLFGWPKDLLPDLTKIQPHIDQTMTLIGGLNAPQLSLKKSLFLLVRISLKLENCMVYLASDIQK